MNTIQRTFVTLAALFVLVGSLTVVGAQEALQDAVQAVAQEAATEAAPDALQAVAEEVATEAMSVEGELLSVDPDAMTFTIRASDASEHLFGYAEETEVTGAQEGAAGLSTVTGQQVVIAYVPSTDEGGAALATKIEVGS